MTKNIFKASEVDSNKDGWIVDLSPDDIVNPDCYWTLATKKMAQQFANLVNAGYRPGVALNLISGWQS